jgi:hypothetical protein
MQNTTFFFSCLFVLDERLFFHGVLSFLPAPLPHFTPISHPYHRSIYPAQPPVCKSSWKQNVFIPSSIEIGWELTSIVIFLELIPARGVPINLPHRSAEFTTAAVVDAQ